MVNPSPKQYKDDRSQSLTHPVVYPSYECKPDAREFHDCMFNPVLSKKTRGQRQKVINNVIGHIHIR